MSGVSVTGELAAVASTFGWTWDDVQTVTEQALGADSPRTATGSGYEGVRPGYAAPCRTGVAVPPAPGNPGAIFAFLLSCGHRPGVLPDGLSGHERIRAVRVHTWAQLIASRNAARRRLSRDALRAVNGAPPHGFGPPVSFESARSRTSVRTARPRASRRTPPRLADRPAHLPPAGSAPAAGDNPRAPPPPPPPSGRHPAGHYAPAP